MTGDSERTSERLANSRLLDTGAQAEIYEWGDGRVLRLLPATSSPTELAAEAAVMRAALGAGVPVPAVHEVLTIDGRPGMVLDRIDGGPMLSVMLGRPWKLLPLVRRFGRIQAGIHGSAVPADLRSVHEQVTAQLDRLELEAPALREWALRELERLPAGASLLHGDYHPLNLLMNHGDPVVIDWPGAAVGPPEADIARTRLLVEAAEPPNGSPLLLTLMGAFRTRLFLPQYLRGYRRVRDYDRELVARWLPVRAADRLAEAPPNERAVLLKLLQAGGAPV